MYVCHTKKRCQTCGENHTYEQYQSEETRVCCNCGLAHSAAYSKCQASVKTLQGISHAEVVKGISREEGGLCVEVITFKNNSHHQSNS